jgi:hypothetical protein
VSCEAEKCPHCGHPLDYWGALIGLVLSLLLLGFLVYALFVPVSKCPTCEGIGTFIIKCPDCNGKGEQTLFRVAASWVRKNI